MAKVQQHFLPVDQEVITSIPLSCTSTNDRWRWHFGKRGEFLVKTAYRVASSSSSPSQSSSESDFHSWWKLLWNLNIPPKVKLFIWRACRNVLPVKVNLIRKGIGLSDLCPLCCSGLETSEHALLWCHLVKPVWSSLLTNFSVPFNSNLSFFDFLWLLFKICSNDLLCQFCVACWGSWNNALIHGNQVKSPQEVLASALGFFAEFQTLQLSQNVHFLAPPSPSKSDWIPPPPGAFKVNSDASVHKHKSNIGIGAAIKDHHGFEIAAISKSIQGTFSPELAELLAAREGLILARSKNLSIHSLEVDASNVAQLLNSTSLGRDEASLLAEDIKSLSIDVNCSLFLAIPRSGNALAHHLAALALFSSKTSCWQSVSAACISSSSVGL